MFLIRKSSRKPITGDVLHDTLETFLAIPLRFLRSGSGVLDGGKHILFLLVTLPINLLVLVG
jgi:hypothetical protein